MDLKLTGKNVLITGSSMGIGKAIALAFAEQGANVLINYVGDDQIAETTRLEAEKFEVKALKYNADVSDSKQVSEMFQYL